MYRNVLRRAIVSWKMKPCLHQPARNRLWYRIDPLTHLANRIALHEALMRIESAPACPQYQALLILDLDRFRTINHTQGHVTGDRILIELASRFQHLLGTQGDLYRSGGDEFSVLYETPFHEESHAKDAALFLAKKLSYVASSVLTIDHKSFRLSASIGIIVFKNRSYSAEHLFQYADSALFRAKEEGKNTIRFFQSDFQTHLESKAVFLEQLLFAVENDQLELFYQTQTTLTCENAPRIYGAEALIRWHHPHIGTVAPNRFIPLAEESGLIIPLGHWILEHAMRQLKAWENDPDKHTWRLSINISTKQFEHESFLPSVCALLKRIACDPRKICFELTESLLIQDAKKALRKIFELKRLGILLSIDDFGTGFSSLSYLRRLKVDELKIDKSFVRRMLSSPVDRTIIETILTLGKRFNLAIVAEGIETQAQFQALKNLGCRSFQGYLFHKPCSVALIGSF